MPIIYVLLLYALISPVLSLMWINSAFFSIDVLALVIKFFSILFFVTASSYILFIIFVKRKFKSRLFFKIVMCLIGFGCFATFIGLVNGFSGKTIPDFYTLINGPLIAFGIVQSPLSSKQIEKFVKIFAGIYLSVFILCLIAMNIETYLGVKYYPALASGWLMLGLSYYMKKRKKLLVLLTFIAIIFSGKRSIAAVMLMTLPLAYILNKKISFSIGFIISLAISIPVLVISLWGFSIMEKNIDSIPFGHSVINKVSLINPLSDRFNFRLAAGERVEEVFQSVEAQAQYPLSFFIGAGNGFVYDLKVARKKLDEKERHNVHFSPLTYFTRYGIFFTIIFYATFFLYLNDLSKKMARNQEPVFQSLSIYQYAGFIASFMSFSLSMDYLFWACIGLTILLSRIAKNENKEIKLLPLLQS